MKKIILMLVMAALLPVSVKAQVGQGGQGGRGGPGGLGGGGRGGASALLDPLPAAALQLPRFDLDFPGGTPVMLARAIEKASGKPLNAIIPDEYADMQMPPLKMRGVNTPELFQALISVSEKQTNYATSTRLDGQRSFAFTTTSFGFRTVGTPREDSIWSFFCQRPLTPPEFERQPVCRFFQLGPYLEKYKIEDITTAIETGWKMLGVSREFAAPQISFHKDTKLLIAVGDPEKLKLIDSVLEQLLPNPKDPKNKPAAGRESRPPAKSGDSDQQ